VAKVKAVFVCQKCGYKNPKWLGRCPECNEFGTLVEELEKQIAGREERSGGSTKIEAPVSLTAIEASKTPRVVLGMPEVDRVLGGGMVHGSVLLIGGDPGIGKSTLVMQIAQKVAVQGVKVLYITAEESQLQLKLRAERLGVTSGNIMIASETNLDGIRMALEGEKPGLAIIDSIQMVYRSELPSAPGSVGQVRECSAELSQIAKRNGISLLIIGHVTKGGELAGPKTLEHIVDAVFYFEGDRFQAFRILRSIKNRFGSTFEVGIFEMNPDGLREVSNPSEFFMGQDRQGRLGSVVTPTMVGTRTLLVEMQALTAKSSNFNPTRKVSGVDYNRVLMLIAVLQRRMGLAIDHDDVFVNAVGGATVEEPAADLAMALAIASSFRGNAVDPRIAVVGEVGLAGEIRGVVQANARVAEARRLGFSKILIPKDNLRGIEKSSGITVVPVGKLEEALQNTGLW
jgi:DNA repair protein RadA/Sms